MRELAFERLADEGDIVGSAAAAARLGDENGGVLHVVLAAFEGVDKLPRHAQGREAGVVMDVFQALVDDGARIVAQELDVPAVAAQKIDDDAEVHGQHVRNQNFMRMLHLWGEAGIVVAEVCDFTLLLRFFPVHWARLFCSSTAASMLRRRILTTPRLLISSILIWVYNLPRLSKMARTSSVVMASMPQPKETSCTRSISACSETYSAAR